jgi:hypothetical protein
MRATRSTGDEVRYELAYPLLAISVDTTISYLVDRVPRRRYYGKMGSEDGAQLVSDVAMDQG